MLTFYWIWRLIGPWQPANDVTDYKQHTAKKQRAHEHDHGHADSRRDFPFCILHLHRLIKPQHFVFYFTALSTHAWFNIGLLKINVKYEHETRDWNTHTNRVFQKTWDIMQRSQPVRQLHGKPELLAL